MNKNIYFTYFDSINSNAQYNIDVKSYVDSVKIGFTKNAVLKARTEYEQNGKTKTYNKLKANIPAVTISCTIKKGLSHKGNNIETQNNIICLDIDNDENNKGKLNNEIIEQLKADPQTFILHNSISGIGICLFVLIENDSDYINTFRSLEHYYKSKYNLVIDESCSNINRLRFFSFDPDIYYNPNAIKHVTDVPNGYISPLRIKPIKAVKKDIDVSKWIIETNEIFNINTFESNGYKVQLEPYSMIRKKYKCPECDELSFTHYIDANTGLRIDNKVGRCDRKNKCGYHKTPKEYFKDNPNKEINKEIDNDRVKALEDYNKRKYAYFNTQIVNDSQKGTSNFVKFLYSKFDKNKVDEVVKLYHLGTSREFNSDSVIFWDITAKGEVLNGSIMQYDSNTGKRIKEPYNQIKSVSSALELNSKYCFKQGLFGEHLTALYPNKEIRIVESQKTAVICSIVMDQYNWIACNGIEKLTQNKLSNIIHYRKENKIALVPDLDAIDKWIIKGNDLGLSVSRLIENFATEQDKANGLDIADIILQMI